MMKLQIATILALTWGSAWSSSVYSQTFSNGYVPYTPPVVGGLPPNSSGLEQPVYVADRGSENPYANAMGQPDSAEPHPLSASGLGFDESKAVSAPQNMDRFEAGTPVAVVGEEWILLGDLIQPNKLTPQIIASTQFEMELRKGLVEIVTRKALAQRFVNDKVAGKSLKERAEARKHIQTQTAKIFHEKWKPLQKEHMKCESDLDFELKLAQKGRSLFSMQQEFSETTWAQEHLRENVNEKPIIELSEIHDYYEDHESEFQRRARAKFRILAASFSKFPNKQAAYDAIVDMGNEVYFSSEFSGVAKRKSTDFRAAEGGVFDWTTQGALKSKPIDAAIFELPIGKLSQIIEDNDGYYIVEVLEREPARVEPFASVQADIRKALSKRKVDDMRKEFISKVRAETPVWTRWPEDIPGSKDIQLLMQ